MVYVDSNVFIYPVIYDETKVDKARKAKAILERIANGRLEAYSATLTWDEVTWVTLKVLGEVDAVEQGRKFLAFPNLTLVSITEEAITRAQHLMEKYRLKPRDAIHAATCIEAGQKEIISDDHDFDKIQNIKRIPL